MQPFWHTVFVLWRLIASLLAAPHLAFGPCGSDCSQPSSARSAGRRARCRDRPSAESVRWSCPGCVAISEPVIRKRPIRLINQMLNGAESGASNAGGQSSNTARLRWKTRRRFRSAVIPSNSTARGVLKPPWHWPPSRAGAAPADRPFQLPAQFVLRFRWLLPSMRERRC